MSKMTKEIFFLALTLGHRDNSVLLKFICVSLVMSSIWLISPIFNYQAQNWKVKTTLQYSKNSPVEASFGILETTLKETTLKEDSLLLHVLQKYHGKIFSSVESEHKHWEESIKVGISCIGL